MDHSGEAIDFQGVNQLIYLSASHLWESFVREAREGYEWLHEKTSIDMLQFIIEDNNLLPVFQSYGLTERDITFVKVLLVWFFFTLLTI